MSTGELRRLQAADPAVQEAWIGGDEAARDGVLAELADAPLPAPSPVTGAAPVRPDVLGWFAAPEDLCRVMARLLAASDEAGQDPLEAILMTAVGVPDSDDRWTRMAFKGGSDGGVLAAVWVLEQADGPTRALAASLVDPTAPLDGIQGVLLLAAARDLLAGP